MSRGRKDGECNKRTFTIPISLSASSRAAKKARTSSTNFGPAEGSERRVSTSREASRQLRLWVDGWEEAEAAGTDLGGIGFGEEVVIDLGEGEVMQNAGVTS